MTAPVPAQPPVSALPPAPRHAWLERLQLTQFRNYASARFDVMPAPVVIVGPNGAGKTNLLEAVSLLSPGQGLRRVGYAEMARLGGDGSWSVAMTVHNGDQRYGIGTGVESEAAARGATGRSVRIDGEPAASSALAEIVEVLWLTPAMDGLFTASAGERRRFFDRLIASIDPSHRRRVAQFERAMRQRNKLLEQPRARPAEFSGLELQMAETGTAMAAARRQTVATLEHTIAVRAGRDPTSPFPWAGIAVRGLLEDHLADAAAVEVEDAYRQRLAAERDRDRAAGRTLSGPHLADLVVTHGPKLMPAHLSSTGEQKALLINLVLAHAELVAAERMRPLLLLDEITAHLDDARRAALFGEILATATQAWMTGTDRSAFAALEPHAQFLSPN